MALNLEELSFQVNTEKLKEAVLELGNLKSAISNLNTTSSNTASEQSKLAKSTEKLADSTEESTTKLSAVEKMLDKTATKMKVLRGQTIELADGVENLGKGFTSSQASQVAIARQLGATSDQIKMLTQSFKEYNDMTGVNTFDASANGLSRLTKEIRELTSISQLAAKGYGLTRDELKLLARDSNALTQAFNQEGRSIEELASELNRLEQEFVSASRQRNSLIAQSKQVELQVKAEADAIAAAARAQEDSAQSMFRNHQLRLKQEEETHKAIMSDMAAFYKEQEKQSNVKTVGGNSQQPMDSAVAQYYKQQAASTDAAAKATAFLEREMLRIDNVLEGFNTNLAISSSNRLLKFREQLALTGADADTAALKYEAYAERIRKADEHKAKVQKNSREEELKYLARATSVQLGDIGISLAGGQNPFMVLIQQGDQLRGVLNQVGGDAKEMQQAMSLAFKQIVVGFVDVAKALGSFTIGAFADTGKAIVDTAAKFTGLNFVLENSKRLLANLAEDGLGAAYKLDQAMKAMAMAVGVSVGAAIATLLMLAVALKDVIQEETALSKAMIVTGASLGLSKQAAIDYASSMESVGVSQSKATEFITELGKQGGFTKQAIDDLTKAAIDLEKYAGVAISDTVKEAAKFQDKPFEALVKYAEQTGLVTIEQLKFVKSLEDQGKKAQATEEAIRLMGQATQAQADITKASLSPIDALWIDITSSISKAWESVKEFARSESLVSGLRVAFAGLAAVVELVWTGIKSVASGIGALAAMFSAAMSGDFTAAKSIFKEFTTDVNKNLNNIGNNFKQNFNGTNTEGLKEGLKLTAQQMEKNVVAANEYAASQKKLKEKKSKGKSDAEKELEAYNKLVSDLSDQTSGLNANYSENFALIVKLAKTEEQRVEQITQLLMKQPIYQQGLKAEADAHKENQKSLDDLVDSILKVEKEKDKQEEQNKKLLGWSQEQTLSLAQESEQLAIQARMLGLTSEQREKELGLLKAKVQYEKDLNKIENDKADVSTQAKARLEALARYEKAVENVNSKLALDAAQKLLNEINNIKSGLADAIVTGLFEGGKAGAKKLRDVITSELKRQITLQINANVKTASAASAINRAGSITGNFASNYSTSGFGTALTSGLDDAGQWARDYWAETGNEMFQGIGETLGTWSSNVGQFSGVINDAVGYLGAFNTALNGDYGAAIGEGLGYYFGGPIGAAIGKEIGSWLGLTDSSGTIHTGGIASYNSATGTQTSTTHGAFGTGFGGVDYGKQTTDMVSSIAKGVSQMLDATATTFGKTVGYSVATAFADDTSKDGAWGALVIKLGDSLVTSWEDSRVSKWAPKVFADGEAGAKEYALAVAKDVRDVLLEQTPDWADTMLKALGDAPTLEGLTAVVAQINAVAKALESMKEVSKQFVGLSEEVTSALIKALGGAESALSKLNAYYGDFFSEEERKALTLSQLQKDFTSAGLGSIPKTREEYRKLVEAQDLTTEAGRKQYAELIRLAPVFASVTSSIEDTAKSAKDAAEEIVKANKQLYDEAKSATDKALADTKEVINREKEKAQVALNAATTARDSLKSIFDLLQSNIKDLYSEVSSTAAMQASEAGLIISNAASSGVLPSSDVLSGAISTVRSSIGSTNYSSKYEADKARLDFANNLKLIQEQAGVQLTNAEQQVNLLKDQIDQYDLMIKTLEDQVDVLRGIGTAALSIDESLKLLTEKIKAEKAAATSATSTSTQGTSGGVQNDGKSSSNVATTNLGLSQQQDIAQYIRNSDFSEKSVNKTVIQMAQDAKKLGYTQKDIAAVIGWSEKEVADYMYNAARIPAFADGGYHSGGLRLVGEETPELEVTGPARYYNASQMYEMLSEGSSSESHQQTELLRAEVRATAQNTAKLARLVERLIVPTSSGEALQTTAVVA